MDENRADNGLHYQARSVAWSVYSDDQPIRAVLDRVFADLIAPAVDDATQFKIRRSQLPNRLVLAQDGHETIHASAHAIDRLIGFLNQGVLDAATDILNLHAAALTDQEAGLTVLATAASGGGKTTLAAYLCRAGWSYLSDETIGINVSDGSLVGDGKPLTIKEGLHATLGIDLAPLTIDPALQNRWYVRPAVLGGTISTGFGKTAPPPTDVVFMEFDSREATTSVTEVAAHHALIRLLSNTYRLDQHGADALPTLARLVARARVWEVRTGDGAQAVAQLLGMIRDRPLPNHRLFHCVAPAELAVAAGPAPRPQTVFAGFAGSGAVVHDYERSRAVALDATGMVVWQLLDGSASIAELADELAEHFDVPARTIATGVEILCDDLASQGFVLLPS